MNAIFEAARGNGQWATFALGGEQFALKVEHVQEVLMPQTLTPVPLAPEHVVGLLNLRGQIMPAIELRHLLGFAPREGPAGNLLVVSTPGGAVSLVVDKIGDVLELPAESWKPAPDTLGPEHKRHVFGIRPIEKGVVLGLRVEALLPE